MNPVSIATTALGLILDAYKAAQASNDAQAIADLDALLASHEIGRRIVAQADRALGVIEAGRAGLRTPVMGVPAFVASDS